MNTTKIEYLTHTWNPIAMLCDPVSPGCEKCWHRRRAKMLAGNEKLEEPARKAWAGGPPWLNLKELAAPRKAEKPRRIGVQFMGDWLHEQVFHPPLKPQKIYLPGVVDENDQPKAVGQGFDSALACDWSKSGCSNIPVSGFYDPSSR